MKKIIPLLTVFILVFACFSSNLSAQKKVDFSINIGTILHHKLSGWQEVSRQDVLAVLDALKQLALAED